MSQVPVDKEEYLSIIEGANKLMDCVEELQREIAERDLKIDAQNLELNALSLSKAQFTSVSTDTLVRMRKLLDE